MGSKFRVERPWHWWLTLALLLGSGAANLIAVIAFPEPFWPTLSAFMAGLCLGLAIAHVAMPVRLAQLVEADRQQMEIDIARAMEGAIQRMRNAGYDVELTNQQLRIGVH